MASLLPPNVTALEHALEETEKRLDAVPVPLDTLWSSERCPSALLPWLAWSFSVDLWDAEWPEDMKRRVIAESFEVHRRKGTVGALKRALEALGLCNITVTEWFEESPQADPFTFRVEAELGTRGLSPREHDQLSKIINTTKNVRSWLRDLVIYLLCRTTCPYVAATVTSGEDLTCRPRPVTRATVSAPAPFFGMGNHIIESYTVLPRSLPA